jgi:dihydrofolate reductase
VSRPDEAAVHDRHLDDRHHDTEADMTTTRALISAMQVTLDGYILGPEEESDWVDSWSDALELLPPVDTFVLGGGMFPQYGQFWTTVLDDPGAAAEMLGREPYPRELSYAKLAAETPHLVVSSTLTESDTSWRPTRIVGIDEVRALKEQRGDAVYVVGGPRLMTSLLRTGVLDELRLIVHPVAVGSGTALFGGITERQELELVAAERLAAGRLVLTYRPGHLRESDR